MADEQNMRLECAVLFSEVKTGIASQLEALNSLTASVNGSIARQEERHVSLSAQFSDLNSQTRERLALVESSTKAAHRRIDGYTKIVWGVVVIMLTSAVGVLIKLAMMGAQ